MITDLLKDYHKGEMSGLLYAGVISAQSAASAANNVFRVSKLAKPLGADANEMIRCARQLEDAAACYRAAAAKAYDAPVLVAAE